MTIQYTPIYQIPYPQASDPIKTTQTTLENQAKRIEQVFTDASFPASNPDVASMTARLNALEKGPRGIQAKAIANSGSGAIAAQTIVQNIPTVSFVAGRAYMIEWNFNFYVDNTSATFAFGISHTSTADAAGAITGLTQVKTVSERASASGEGRNIIVRGLFLPSTTQTRQIKVWVQRVVGGSGAVYATADATNPNILHVEDIGTNPV